MTLRDVHVLHCLCDEDTLDRRCQTLRVGIAEPVPPGLVEALRRTVKALESVLARRGGTMALSKTDERVAEIAGALNQARAALAATPEAPHDGLAATARERDANLLRAAMAFVAWASERIKERDMIFPEEIDVRLQPVRTANWLRAEARADLGAPAATPDSGGGR